jgi:dTDP-4-dehydrorhamnose reductase
MAAKKIDAKVVYVSTDYVFDGAKGLYKEQDAVCPVNHYGVTKLKGEDVVRNLVDEWLIVRPSVIYGAGTKKNFVMWILENLQRQNTIRVVNDQYVSPTLNTDLSEQIVALLSKEVTGVVHTAGGERVDRFSFSQMVADVFGLDTSLIQGISMKEMTWVAKRPVDSSLDVSTVMRFKKPYKLKEAVNLLKEEIERRL